jgi:hypothetical protein
MAKINHLAMIKALLLVIEIGEDKETKVELNKDYLSEKDLEDLIYMVVNVEKWVRGERAIGQPSCSSRERCLVLGRCVRDPVCND